MVRNTIWLTLAEVATRLLKAGQICLIVRYLGPRTYGGFAFAFSFVSIFGAIFDSGLVLGLTRDWSKHPGREDLIKDAAGLKLLLGSGACLIVYVVGRLTITNQDVRLMSLLLAGNLFVSDYVALSYALFRARQTIEFEFAIRLTQSIAMFLLVLGVLNLGPSGPNVCIAYLCASIGTLVLALLVVWIRGGPLGLSCDLSTWARLLRVGAPLAAVGAIGTLYGNIDSILLGWWRGMNQVGWYDAADRLIGFAVLPMSLLWLASLPAFASGAAKVDEVFRRRWQTWTTMMTASAMFVGTMLVAEARPIVHLVYGISFESAAPVLQLLTVALVIQYLYTPSYQALLVFDQQKQAVKALVPALIINVAFNVALIPRYGIRGAAVSAVATHLCIFVMFSYMTAKLTPIAPFNRSAIGSSATFGLAGLLTLIVMKCVGRNLPEAVAVGCMTYGACLLPTLRLGTTSGRALVQI